MKRMIHPLYTLQNLLSSLGINTSHLEEGLTLRNTFSRLPTQARIETIFEISGSINATEVSLVAFFTHGRYPFHRLRKIVCCENANDERTRLMNKETV